MKTKIIIMVQLSLSALLISAATTAALNDTNIAQLKAEQEEVRSELMKLVSVRPERVDSAVPASQQDKNLRLRADIAEALQVSDQHIHWTISQRDKVITQLYGNLQGADLPTGSYTVGLAIGQYRVEKQVDIRRGQQVQPYFGTELTALQLRSNKVADWLITGADGRSYRINGKSRLKEWLPTGNYTVRASFGGDITLHKKIHLRAGQPLQARMLVPIGEVRLIATKDNQPLFRAVNWDIYRLTKHERKLVGNYDLHSRSISIPPGHYEAVASHRDISGSRQFRVREGSINNVVLALD